MRRAAQHLGNLGAAFRGDVHKKKSFGSNRAQKPAGLRGGSQLTLKVSGNGEGNILPVRWDSTKEWQEEEKDQLVEDKCAASAPGMVRFMKDPYSAF